MSREFGEIGSGIIAGLETPHARFKFSRGSHEEGLTAQMTPEWKEEILNRVRSAPDRDTVIRRILKRVEQTHP